MFGLIAILGAAFLAWLATSRLPGLDVWLRVPLSLALALGATSIVFFWTGMAIGPDVWLQGGVESLLLVAAGICVQRHRRAHIDLLSDRASGGEQTSALASSSGLFIARAVACVGAALACTSLARTALRLPHGGWDAWAVWNLKARFLFREEAPWQGAFSEVQPWAHPDYPLLLPGAAARMWMYGGGETTWVPMLISVGFAIGTLALLYGASARLRGPGLGLLAMLLYLAHENAWLHGASQYADVPLGFFMLAALVLGLLWDRDGDKPPSLMILAGFAAGCAAWTKNEGLLFAVVLIAVRSIHALLRRDGSWRRELPPLALGLAPGLGTMLAFKLWLAPTGDHLAGSASRLEGLLDPERYQMIAAALGSELLWIGPGLLIAVAVWIGVSRGFVQRATRPELICPVLILGAVSAGYFASYLMTPHDLRWHLDSSLDRLVIQLWPSLVLVATLLAPATESWFGWLTSGASRELPEESALHRVVVSDRA